MNPLPSHQVRRLVLASLLLLVLLRLGAPKLGPARNQPPAERTAASSRTALDLQETSSVPRSVGTPSDSEEESQAPTEEEIAKRAATLQAEAQREAEMLSTFLSPERVEQLLRATTLTDEQVRNLELAHADDRAWESDDSENRLHLLAERERIVRETLTDAEFATWVGLLSPEANLMSERIPDRTASERAEVARAEYEFERSLRWEGADPETLTLRRNEKLNEILGAAGAADYLRRSDPSFLGEMQFGRELNLPAEDVGNLYDWRAALDARERALIEEGVPDTERFTLLRKAAEEARKVLSASLGEEGFAAYLESGAGLWMNRFEGDE